MIKFTLVCSSGHEFQSWFKSGEAFDEQAKAGLVCCPLCDTAQVAKAIMAPAIAGRRGEDRQAQELSRGDGTQAKDQLLEPRDAEVLQIISAFRKRVFAVAEDVGTRFTEEARKIHRGLVPERPIHGQATFEDARALLEEGVTVLPVPPLPDEYN